VLQTGQKYIGYKLEYHPSNSEMMYFNLSVSQLSDHAGEVLGLVAIFEDVTKQVEMEKEMQRIAELAATGQLAASIAHELRNPLSSIKGAAQYLRNEYDDHAAVREFLDIIIDEVNVLNGITTEFLDYARPTRLNLSESDVNDLLFRTLQFMQLEIDKQNVNVTEEMSYNVPLITADARQLEQVFRNLFLNAIQAMPEGGNLTISTSPVREGVKVVIADSGVGIPEDKMGQIFVPFFTTKTKGTGLGLAIVEKIIVNHGGKINVASHPGLGTTFEIILPISSDRARATTYQSESEADFLRREPGMFQ
jgi:two-component system sensor histidine kinase AtoS